jgi:hypothetical protein
MSDDFVTVEELQQDDHGPRVEAFDAEMQHAIALRCCFSKRVLEDGSEVRRDSAKGQRAEPILDFVVLDASKMFVGWVAKCENSVSVDGNGNGVGLGCHGYEFEGAFRQNRDG